MLPGQLCICPVELISSARDLLQMRVRDADGAGVRQAGDRSGRLLVLRPGHERVQSDQALLAAMEVPDELLLPARHRMGHRRY